MCFAMISQDAFLNQHSIAKGIQMLDFRSVRQHATPFQTEYECYIGEMHV